MCAYSVIYESLEIGAITTEVFPLLSALVLKMIAPISIFGHVG
jgi:hypothetical protein